MMRRTTVSDDRPLAEAMGNLQLKIDYASHVGTVIGSMQLSLEGGAGLVSVYHFPFRKADGSIDLRYSPKSQHFLFKEFFDLLNEAHSFGDYRLWQYDFAERIPASLNAFASVESDEVRRGKFHVGRNGLFLNVWPYEPLYKAGGFEAFAEAARCMKGVIAALEGAGNGGAEAT